MEFNKHIFWGTVIGAGTFMIVVSLILVNNKKKHETDSITNKK